MFNNSNLVAGAAGAGVWAEKPDLQPRLPLLSPELHAARRPLRPHGLRPQLQRGPAGQPGLCGTLPGPAAGAPGGPRLSLLREGLQEPGRVEGRVVNSDPGGQKLPIKIEKKERIFMFWSAGCSLLRVEGFSCSLGVLKGGLGISKLHFLFKKVNTKFPAVNFFQFLAIRTLDLELDSDPHWDLDPDPQLEKMP